MIKFRSTATVMGVVWLAVCGCGKKAAPASMAEAGGSKGFASFSVGKEARPLAELKADDVIVSVNGTVLTRRTYDALLRGLEESFRSSNPKASPLAVSAYRERRAKSLVNEFLTKQVFLEEAKRKGLRAAPEIRAEVLSGLESFAKKKGMTVEELGKSGDLSDRLLVQGAEDQALIVTLRRAEFGDKLTVTDADIAAARERLTQYNAMCEKTNALVKARAEVLCQRLRGGEDFQRVAAEVSEDRESQNGVWGTFVRAEIEDAAVRSAAFTAPVGSIAGPFDTEEGLVIVKVLEREGIDSVVAKDEATVKLGRILLRLGQLAEMPDAATLRAEVEKNRLQSLQRPWLAEMQKKVRVEFPNGTNLFKVAKKR